MISELTITGPVGLRRGTLAHVCDANVGHVHAYDHVTIVIRGRIRVLYSYLQDGCTVTGESREFNQGDIVTIKAQVRHTIKALTDDVHYLCVFSHRDFDGVVSETYHGHDLAYA